MRDQLPQAISACPSAAIERDVARHRLTLSSSDVRRVMTMLAHSQNLVIGLGAAIERMQDIGMIASRDRSMPVITRLDLDSGSIKKMIRSH